MDHQQIVPAVAKDQLLVKVTAQITEALVGEKALEVAIHLRAVVAVEVRRVEATLVAQAVAVVVATLPEVVALPEVVDLLVVAPQAVAVVAAALPEVVDLLVVAPQAVAEAV